MWLRPWRENMFYRSQYQVSTRNHCDTNRALYLIISLFSLCFRTNTHFYPTGFTSSGVWSIGPKTSSFVHKCNFACIAYFHFSQSFLCRHSSTFRFRIFIIFYDIMGHLKVKILLIAILLGSYFCPVCT